MPPVYLLPDLPVLRLDEVAEVLGLLVAVVVVAMVIVAVVLGPNVAHLVDTAALGAALNGALLGNLSYLAVSSHHSPSSHTPHACSLSSPLVVAEMDIPSTKSRGASQQGSPCNRSTAPRRQSAP